MTESGAKYLDTTTTATSTSTSTTAPAATRPGRAAGADGGGGPEGVVEERSHDTAVCFGWCVTAAWPTGDGDAALIPATSWVSASRSAWALTPSLPAGCFGSAAKYLDTTATATSTSTSTTAATATTLAVALMCSLR